MKKFPNKKFILHQSKKQVDVKTEIFVLTDLLKRMEEEEKYELAAVVKGRLESIKDDESQAGSY